MSTTPEQDVAPAADSLTSRAADAFASYRQGTTSALSTLVSMVTPLLWHVARASGLSQVRAEDVVQTTWLRLVEHADGIHEARAVVGWLCTTTKRESWKVQRAERIIEPIDDNAEQATGPTPHDPAALAELNDEAQRLWRHFLTLSPRCQQLLRVICMGGAPDYAELSAALGMPVGSIGPTRGRCLATLRQALLSDPDWS